MGYEKEKIPPLTLIFRYLTLSVMTLVLTAMVIASFWMVHSFVNFVYLEPGISAGSLSLGYQDIFLIREKGAIVVTGVDSGSAAEKAGIQVGDSIIAVNGVRLKEKPQAYFRPLLRAGTGKEIKFELIRNGVKEWRVVVLEEREPGEITVTAQGFPIKGSVRKVWWSVYLPLCLSYYCQLSF
jgi:C-terminal processing protease CtpA/Prc